jgi:Flp pilus assembly protein TadD
VPAPKEAKIRHKSGAKGPHSGPAGAPPGPRHPASSHHSQARSRTSIALLTGTNSLALIAAAFAAVLYLPTVEYGWVWDDGLLVVTAGAGGLGAEGLRPISSLSFRLGWWIGYGTPFFAHCVNILLHAVATWLVFRLAIHIGAIALVAFGAALLFAAHPIHTEAVAYVSGRPDLLATVFALTAILLARRRVLCRPEGCRSIQIWPAYGALALALLSDEVAVVTPLLVMGLDRFGPEPVPWRRRRVHYAGMLAITLVYVLLRATQGSAAAPAAGSAHQISGIDQGAGIWAGPISLYESLRLLLIPHPLNALRTLTLEQAASWSSRLAPLLALALVAAFTAWRRKDPLARTGALFLLLPLLPAMPASFLVGSFAEERAVYFASVGFALLVGSALTWLAKRGSRFVPAVGALSVGLAALGAFATEVRLPVWKNNVSLLQAAARAAPQDPAPHLALIEHFTADGNWQAALTEVDRAIALDPENARAVRMRTAILDQLGLYRDSEISARRAIELDPRDATSYANLGNALIQQDRSQEATDACRQAVALDSTLVNGWYNLGVALTNVGDLSGAIVAYQRAISLQPQDVPALNNLGVLYGSTGRIAEAKDLYVRLVGLAPNSIEARMNLALAYLRLGDRENAAKERETIRRLNPSAVRQLDLYFKEHMPDLSKLGVGAPRTSVGKR